MPSAHHALGLTVIILCGEGSDLKPITTTLKLPKALLPVANKPMIQYPLEWVLEAGLDCTTPTTPNRFGGILLTITS